MSLIENSFFENIANIYEKIILYEFENIDIEKIKQNNFLYQITLIFFEKNIFIQKVSDIHLQNDIECPILKIFVDVLNIKLNLFDFENSKTNYIEIYNKLYTLINKLKQSDNISTKFYEFLCYMFNNMNYILKYLDPNSIKEICYEKTIFDDIREIRNNIGTHQFDKIMSLLNDFITKYPNRGVRYIEYVRNICQLIQNNDDEQLKICITNINDILNISYNQINLNLLKINKIYKNYNILNHLRIKKKQNLYEFVKKFLINDNEYGIYNDNMYHIMKIDEILNLPNNDKKTYLNYLDDLVQKKSPLLAESLFCEYITMMYYDAQYKNCVIYYKNYKEALLFILEKPCNPLVKINLTYFIIMSHIHCNIYIGAKEVIDIINKIEFPKNFIVNNYSKLYEKIISFKNTFEFIEKFISEKGFEIKYVNQSQNDCCIICHEDIDENQTTTICCNTCKKEIGHYICVMQWFKSEISCPHCRHK